MRHARFPALVVAVALAAAACSSSGADPEPTEAPTTSESATPSASPSPSATASEVDLSAPPPDEVTEEYVQKVLEAIYAVEAESIRVEAEAAREGATAPPEQALELLRTIYDDAKLTRALRDVGSNWEDGQLQVEYAATPSPPIIEVQRLVDSEAGCLVAIFTLDRSPTLAREVETRRLIALLNTKPDAVDTAGRNPAPWLIVDQGVMNDEVEASCE